MVDLSGQWRIRSWFPELDERVHERLRIYHLELIRWTKTINLISPSSVPNADLVHFADSILGAQHVLKDLGATSEKMELWDIGSGNGFPGVVFAILRPQMGVICVESDERKASFLKQLAMRLELDTIGVRRERFEKLPADSINLAVVRGFASISSTLAPGTRLFSRGGRIYHFKGPDWVKEVKDIQGASLKDWETTLIAEYELNGEKAETAKAEQSRPKRAIVKSLRR